MSTMLHVVTNPAEPLTPPLTPSPSWAAAMKLASSPSPALPPIHNLFGTEFASPRNQEPSPSSAMPIPMTLCVEGDQAADDDTELPIPTHYILDKLSILGPAFYNDASTADLILRVVVQEEPNASMHDPLTSQTTATLTSPPTPPKYKIHSDHPAHTPFLSARSPRLRALIFACDAARATSNLSFRPIKHSRPSARLTPYTRYIGTPTRRKLPLHPPSPETFGAVMRWMYTSDVEGLRRYFEGMEDGGCRAKEGVWANAVWLGMEDEVLSGVCGRGWEEGDEGEEEEEEEERGRSRVKVEVM
ncbi:hypothetical protein HDV00_008570 [Rhizophlyctis rosea]|nr:hypothetical protein HDV00_008570 [Rhizophlyctis rosea]